MRLSWLFLVSLMGLNLSAAETVRVAVTKDNSIVLVDGEWTLNAGDQGRIRIKGNQHIVAMAFDVAAIAGRRVKEATLVCQRSAESIRGVTLSTIATPWDEKASNALTAGTPGLIDWGYPGARFPAVCGGNSFTLATQTDSELREGAYHWNVPADLVHAMVIGIADGIAIHEHDADYGRNPTIFSREQSGKQPVLIVTTEDQPDATPRPVSDLRITSLDDTTTTVSFNAPTSGFAYDVRVDDVPLGRHLIPLVQPNQCQTITLADLTPAAYQNGPHQITVRTLNRTGQRSEAISARFQWQPAAELPSPLMPLTKPTTSQQIVEAERVVKEISVIPITDKFDLQGQPIGNLPAGYRTQNPIFDGEQVRLMAAAGEVVSFQTLIRGIDDVSIRIGFDDWQPRIDLHQAIYVRAGDRNIPDPVVPLPKKLSLHPDEDQVVVADIYVPFDSERTVHHGQIDVSDGRSIGMELIVLPFALPRQATFHCEMNSYGLPDHVDDYYSLQRIAYDHRVHANILHYSHHTAAAGSRKSNLDMRLRSGKRMDNRRYDAIEPGAKSAYWDDFAEAFGPVLDGSLFRDGHRGPIAVPGFYLTFHESWPLHCRPFFNGELDAYRAFNDHPEYPQTYVNILEDFIKTAKSKNWNGAGFQIYFNNKGSLEESQKAPWILDEPTSYWDYRALQYYGELTDRGRADADGVQIDYRIDISRPQFCRGQLSGRDDFWVVSSAAFRDHRRLVTDPIRADGQKVWVYGTSNLVEQSNRNLQAWALDAWLGGASGLVPWQTVDKSGDAMSQADQLGIFIFDQTALGETVIRHSIRLKAYRDAQQLIEYLNLLQDKTGWDGKRMRRFVSQYINLEPRIDRRSDDDAGTSAYDRLSPQGLDNLRHATATMLSQPR